MAGEPSPNLLLGQYRPGQCWASRAQLLKKVKKLMVFLMFFCTHRLRATHMLNQMCKNPSVFNNFIFSSGKNPSVF